MAKRGWRKWAACGDNHGNLVDPKARAAFLKFLDAWKPDDLVHVGDCFDLPGLRAGIRSEDSAACDDLTDDLVAGFTFLERMFDRSAKGAYLLGNHEHRLCRIAESHSNGVMRLAAQEMLARINKQARRTKTPVKPYHHQHGVHHLADGALAFVHGYSANQASVAQHATHYGRGQGGAVIMGHLHRIEQQRGKRAAGTVGYSIGCLADFEKMSYASHRMATAAWGHAWAFGVHRGRAHTVWLATETAGKWLLPSGLEEF